MTFMLEVLAIIFFILGAFFFMVGTVGLIRLPDAFTRTHATTKADTLGLGFIIIGLWLVIGFDVVSLKLLFILVFVWITNPTAAHLIAKALYYYSFKDQKEKQDDRP
jgi:multicomponent Na+:H+ antiporter subunit G